MNNKKITALLVTGFCLLVLTTQTYAHTKNRTGNRLAMRTVPRSASSSSFNPLGISGLVAWWDASDSSTITIATGVSSWTDKSGSSRTATQGTGAAQPTLITAGQNGRNTIRFDGSDDVLGFTTADLPNATIFMVHSVTSGKNTGPFDWTNASQAGFTIYSGAATYRANLVNNSSGVDGTTQQPAAGLTIPVAMNIYTWENSGSTATSYRINGVAQTTGSGTTGVRSQLGRIGRSYTGGAAFFNGDFAEILVYNSILTQTQKESVENYLKTKWGL